jgi:retron-type reverse transcriptase
MGLTVDYRTVYGAWQAFRKGKKPSRAIDEFAYYVEENISVLSMELTGGNYQHGGYQKITVQEKKRRDLAVATVRDRIVHRLLYDFLVEVFDKSFDSDVWSCRKGKGLHGCLARTQQLLTLHQGSYVWRADITKFFDNVVHDTLIDCLRRKVGQDETAMWLCQEVVSSYAFSKKVHTIFKPQRMNF